MNPKDKLTVDENGGSVSFPITIVPIKYGSVPVKVYVSNGVDNDAVERKLLVVVSRSNVLYIVYNNGWHLRRILAMHGNLLKLYTDQVRECCK